MVKLQEVEDEHYVEETAGKEDDDADYTDTDSEISDSDDEDTLEETLAERLSALKDMVPPKARARLSSVFGTTSRLLTAGFRLGGKSLWVLSTSAIMLGVPYALAVNEETQMVEMEKEFKAQQMATSSLSPGAAQDPVPGQPQRA